MGALLPTYVVAMLENEVEAFEARALRYDHFKSPIRLRSSYSTPTRPVRSAYKGAAACQSIALSTWTYDHAALVPIGEIHKNNADG